LAQGKVGSGFDISSAVYGSHLYRRFSPSILTPLMKSPVSPIHLSDLQRRLDPSAWDQSVKPCRLPKGLRLMLADVDAGTDTPSFVGRVLAWKTMEKEEGERLWDSLRQENGAVMRVLTEIAASETQQGYAEALSAAAASGVEQVCRILCR
jgi:phosphomevalonate kinase